MDSLSLAMMDVVAVPPRLRRDQAFVADLHEAALMGAELDWPELAIVLRRPTYANVDTGWPSANWALANAQAGLVAVWARLWGPWYGQRPEVVPVRRRDALGTVIQLADERREPSAA